MVEAFDQTFRDLMGPTADQSPDIIKRLTACVLAIDLELDVKIARKLASTRLHLCIRCLNTARAAAKAAKYQQRKVTQHVRSAR